MHSPSFLLKLFISLNLLAFSMLAHAEQWYHVEMIVFEQLNSVTDEQWPQTKLSDNIPLATGMANTLIQPATNESLISASQRLNRSASYRVHYHQAWQQPILSKRQAKAIAISSDNELIAGDIRLYKSTYLHAQLDLWLMENSAVTNSWSDASPEGVDISAPRNPNLKESRRIRSKKLYFFDHPKLGALLQLTPIETPAAVLDTFEPLSTYTLPTEASATVTE